MGLYSRSEYKPLFKAFSGVFRAYGAQAYAKAESTYRRRNAVKPDTVLDGSPQVQAAIAALRPKTKPRRSPFQDFTYPGQRYGPLIPDEELRPVPVDVMHLLHRAVIELPMRPDQVGTGTKTGDFRVGGRNVFWGHSPRQHSDEGMHVGEYFMRRGRYDDIYLRIQPEYQYTWSDGGFYPGTAGGCIHVFSRSGPVRLDVRARYQMQYRMGLHGMWIAAAGVRETHFSRTFEVIEPPKEKLGPLEYMACEAKRRLEEMEMYRR